MVDLASSYKSKGSSYNFESIKSAARLQEQQVLENAMNLDYGREQEPKSHLVAKIERSFKPNQAVNSLFYHLIMLFEFIQVLFFIFYKVEVINEFSQEHSVFRIDFYFTFMNFQMYILQSGSVEAYLTAYIVITCLFVVYVTAMLVLAPRLFRQDRKEELKDGMKYLMRFFSFLMTCFLFLLQIPMITIHMQGYICGEPDNLVYGLVGVECFSTMHQLLIAFSTLSLILYLAFLFIQSLLFTSNSFESSLPWSSLERELSIARVLIKLLLAAFFVFDKEGWLRGQVDLVCSFLFLFVMYHRQHKALMFKQSVYYAMIVYETQQFWLFFCVSLHILRGINTLNITGLSLMIVIGFLLSGVQIALQERKKRMFVQKDPLHFQTIIDFEVYFFRIYELIMSKDKTDHYTLHGILCNHMTNCVNDKCPCISIMEVQDNVKVDREAIQSQYNNDDNLRGTVNRRVSTLRSTIQQPYGKLSGVGGTITANISRITMNTLVQTRTRRNMRYLVNNGQGDKGQAPETTVSDRKKKKQEAQWFKFLSLLIQIAIERFPKNVDIKIINAFIQNRKIHNEFKAIFELMNCELCNPSFQDQFIIFRRKIQIEQVLKKTYQKNLSEVGKLDVRLVYKYELYFRKYAILEYKTALSALNFWRELLNKNISTQVLQDKGSEISQNYEKIQQLVAKLQKIYPTEIKLLYRYGTFLNQIINNGYDALLLFEKVYYTYHGRISKKFAGSSEVLLFGENAGCAIIIISATSKKIGNIIHANDELESVLGYKRRDILNKNISCIMPKPIGKVHDKFIERYFETAKPTVIDIKRQLFACTNVGYLRAVRLLVKVFPQINDKLVFVGFVQNLKKFDDMEQPKQEYEHLEHQYLLTDKEGNITNVTEGLNHELGLNAKFFQYSDSIFENMFNIQKVCPEILQYEVQEMLEDEGIVLTLDTRNMLNHIELENLNSDEILDIRSKLGKYEVYVQLKTMTLDSNFCEIKLYRIYIVSLVNDITFIQNSQNSKIPNKSNEDVPRLDFGQEGSYAGTATDDFIQAQSIISSISSTTSGSYAFNKIIKDFKKALGQRKTPRNLIFLNRLLIGLLLAIVILISVDFSLKENDLDMMASMNYQGLMIQSRSIEYVELVSNIRSLINIENGLEFQSYDQGSNELKAFSRKEFLRDTLYNQFESLQTKHHYISQGWKTESGTAKIDLEEFDKSEEQMISMYRVSELGGLSEFQIQYRQGLNLYLNYIQDLIYEQSNRTLTINKVFLRGLPQQNSKSNFDDTQKMIYSLLLNGLRDLRIISNNLPLKFYDLTTVNNHNQDYLIILIIGSTITLVLVGLIVYHIRLNEHNQTLILSLYGQLQIKEIEKVHDKCDQYLDELKEGLFGLNTDNHEQNQQPGSLVINSQNLGFISQENLKFTKFKKDNESQISEEEKEAEVYRQFMYRNRLKKFMRSRQAGHHGRSDGSYVTIEQKYKNIVKRTLEQIKTIQHKEEQFSVKQSEKKLFNLRQSIKIEKAQRKQQRRLEREVRKRQKALREIERKKNAQEDDSNSSRAHLKDITLELPQQTERLSEVEQQERAKMFQKQIHEVQWSRHLKLGILAFIFLGYFGYIFGFHVYQQSEANKIQESVPFTYNKYINLMLSYCFLKEKLVNIALANNQSDYQNLNFNFERDNIDTYFHNAQMQTSSILNDLKTDTSYSLQRIVAFIRQIDSEDFCNFTSDFHRDSDYQSLISSQCQTYANGILSKGVSQAIGTFDKKFTDIQITLQDQKNFTTLQRIARQILNDQTINDSGSFKSYYQLLELYIQPIISLLTNQWIETLTQVKEFQHAIIQATFFIFLALVVFLLLISRQKFISDLQNQVFQSRGILNLIPEEFFEQEKDKVESLIKKLKD